MSTPTTDVALRYESNRATALLIRAAQLLARGGIPAEEIQFIIDDLTAWIGRAEGEQ